MSINSSLQPAAAPSVMAALLPIIAVVFIAFLVIGLALSVLPRLVRRKVADFSTWKAAYDAYLPTRQKAGLKEKYVLHNIDDPNEVITLFELEDVQKAREFSIQLICAQGCSKRGRLTNQIFTYSAIERPFPL